MKNWMIKKLMEEEPGKGGGGNQPPANNPPPANDPPPANPDDKKDPPPDDKGDIKNLMDDDPPPANPDDKKDPPPDDKGDKAPTEEEVKAYRDSIAALDLGEGVTMDNPLLDKMMPSLMKMTGGDPKKAEETVKAFADYQRESIKAQEAEIAKDVGDLQKACFDKFGNDTKAMAKKANQVGKRIFGEQFWGEMKKNPYIANHPVVIERFAALEHLFKDDTGAVKKETGAEQRSHDWRESMYGVKK